MIIYKENLSNPKKEREKDMKAKKKLTTVAGAPVPDNQNSMTAGESGPVLLHGA